MQIRKLFILFALSTSITACHSNSDKPKEIIRPAKVMKVGEAITTYQRSFPGIVEANKQVKLSFQVNGRIIEFPVYEGDTLKTGDLIAKLDPRNYEFNLQQTKAQYEYDESQVNRMKQLVDKGFVTRADYDKAVANYNIAKANYSQAKKDLAETVLRAPYTGMVVKKFVKEQQEIKAKEQIVSFQDINQIDIKVSIPENVIANLKREDKPKVNAKFSAVPGKQFAVKLKEFSAEADPATQTYTTVFTMPAPTEINILPGMNAHVLVDFNTRTQQKKVYLIPSAAVYQTADQQPSVWLVNPETETVHRKHVTVGNLVGNQIEIHSGIKPGDEIVIAGVNFLQQGQKINPQLVNKD